MAKGERAFWSSLPGVLTGLAGILTAGVALLGLALSQGWIDDGDTGSGGGVDPRVARLDVVPRTLEFLQGPVGTAMKTVTVTNAGNQSVMVDTEVTGEGEASFEANDGDCTRTEIPSGGTCKVEITFDGAFGPEQATLVISAGEGDGVREVGLQGRAADLLD